MTAWALILLMAAPSPGVTPDIRFQSRESCETAYHVLLADVKKTEFGIKIAHACVEVLR
jgi:hypothetical protein